MDISTALFLERARILEQWDSTILEKKMQEVRVVMHIPLPPYFNAS